MVAGLCLVLQAVLHAVEYSRDVHLAGSIIADYQQVAFLLLAADGDDYVQHRDYRSTKQRHPVKLRACGYARCNSPEEKADIQRILDCRAETHDGQCAHHTQRKHHVGAYRHDDECCDYRSQHHQDIEVLIVDNAAVEEAVNQVYHRAAYRGSQQRNEYSLQRKRIREVRASTED